MKNIYLFVGPSGCGKTTLVESLANLFGYKEVVSYTTRPKRTENETGHFFVTKEEFDALGPKCAYTFYNGYEYGVTNDVIEESDLYVIDPAGVRFMRKNYLGKKNIKVIAMKVSQGEAYRRMCARGDHPDKALDRLINDSEAFKNYLDDADLVIDTSEMPSFLVMKLAKAFIEQMEMN